MAEYRHPFFFMLRSPKEQLMKKSVSTFALTLFIVIALILMNTPTSVQAATQIYFANINSGYADWTATTTMGVLVWSRPLAGVQFELRTQAT